MKIALIGYGKMGRMIEGIARDRGHEIVAVIDRENPEDWDSEAFRRADVAIEFTFPDAAADNVLKCFERGVPVVSGTTGWNGRLSDMMKLCDEGKGTLMWASNFSVGVNIFKAINRYVARLMNVFPQYVPSMVETHHTHKLDHPSGTAVTLAEELLAESDRMNSWAEPQEGSTLAADVLPVDHIREGEVPGIHTISWDSPQDTIILTHSAKSREGFAMGAVLASEWLSGKKGWHSIDEMFSELIRG